MVGHNNVTPCAACKLLRRRCARNCPFFPYFSPQEPQKFASVHKIYGASNVSKILSEVPESQRAETAKSLVYEADARIRDPVYGSVAIISYLQQQAQSLQAELAALKAELMSHKHCGHTLTTTSFAANYDVSPAGIMVSTRSIPNAAREKFTYSPTDMMLSTRNSFVTQSIGCSGPSEILLPASNIVHEPNQNYPQLAPARIFKTSETHAALKFPNQVCL